MRLTVRSRQERSSSAGERQTAFSLKTPSELRQAALRRERSGASSNPAHALG